MSKNVEFFTNFDTFDTFKEFKRELRKEVIDSGLDKSISISADKLKAELKFVVNKKITMNRPEIPSARTTSTTNGLNQPVVNIPKSDDELLKYLTNGKVDPSKYNKAKDYSTLSETNIVFGHGSKGTGAANRVTLRMDIEPGETVESQYQKAAKFFESALFALPNFSGDMDYFVNPGIDMTPFVKIKCSVLTGDGAAPTRKGLNPSQRFEKTKERGYADWTIKQEAVDAVRKNFINITQVMNLAKDGDFEKALDILKIVDKNQKLTGMKEQLGRLVTNPFNKFFQDNQGRWRVKAGSNEGGRYATLLEIQEAGLDNRSRAGTTSSFDAYLNAIKLINNLKITKKINDSDVIYTLVSDYDEFKEDSVDFYNNIQKAIRAWGIANEDYWFNSLVKIAEELIKKYESKE